jgi:glycerophosphoryl diester phosphodiesterase
LFGPYAAGVARPLVIAHRGFHDPAAPGVAENTVEAVAGARAAGADGVEVDVRRSADGVLILHHDPDRPGLGILGHRPYDEIVALAPEVAALDAALDVLPAGLVNLELKCLPWEPDRDDDDRAAVASLAEAVVARGIGERTVVSSFDLGAVDAFRGRAPGVATGWLTWGHPVERTAPLCAEHGHPFLHADVDAVLAEGPAAAVAAAAAAGVRLTVWTVNDPDAIAAMVAAGVHAIVTDAPGLAVRVRDQGTTSRSASGS